MALDLPTVRSGIYNILVATPELAAVGLYKPLTAPTSQLPYAGIRLGPVIRTQKQMGQYTYDAYWDITVLLENLGQGGEVEAQQLYEVLVSRFHAALDANPSLSIPGLVEWSILDRADMLAEPTGEGVWSCEFSFTTSLVTT